jgi:hypothetical protein
VIPEPNAIKIQGSVITGSCKYRKNLQDPAVYKMNAIKQILQTLYLQENSCKYRVCKFQCYKNNFDPVFTNFFL